MPCHEDLVAKAVSGVKWKKAEQLISVAVQTEISISKTEELAEEEADSTQVEKSDVEPSSATGEHCLSHDLPSPRCNTNKLEPTWTREYLRRQQATDPSLKVILQFKEQSPVRPKWEDVSAYDQVVKSLWAQWAQVEIHDGVLCRRWEEGDGVRKTYRIILPRNLQETALKVHHNHTTASHRGVNKTLASMKARYYWPGLTSHVNKWVRSCHECGAKKNGDLRYSST